MKLYSRLSSNLVKRGVKWSDTFFLNKNFIKTNKNQKEKLPLENLLLQTLLDSFSPPPPNNLSFKKVQEPRIIIYTGQLQST